MHEILAKDMVPFPCSLSQSGDVGHHASCRSNYVQVSAPSCRAVVTPDGVGQHMLSVKLDRHQPAAARPILRVEPFESPTTPTICGGCLSLALQCIPHRATSY